MTTLLGSILERRDSLRPAERRVADLIVAHPPRVLDLNLAELATAAGTSEPTVMRFCAAKTTYIRMDTDAAPRFDRDEHDAPP